MADSGLPTDVVDEAQRLTRRARDAVDENEEDSLTEKRDAMLAAHGYAARVRNEGDREVLVCYPSEWIVDGTVRVENVSALDRAIEHPLSESDDDADWAAIDERNRDLAATIRDRYGDVHGDTAEAFADFMGNHYARPVDDATARHRREFLTEYFVRNAWPTPEQRTAAERTLDLLDEVA